jgi:hypothetical protein
MPVHYLAGACLLCALVKQIIDLAPNSLKVQDETDKLPLHWASKYGASSEFINLLIDTFPGSIDAKDKYGNCPLDYASATSHLQHLLRGANFSKPYENNPKDPKTINILNKTGRRLKVEHREALPKKFFQG